MKEEIGKRRIKYNKILIAEMDALEADLFNNNREHWDNVIIDGEVLYLKDMNRDLLDLHARILYFRQIKKDK